MMLILRRRELDNRAGRLATFFDERYICCEVAESAFKKTINLILKISEL